MWLRFQNIYSVNKNLKEFNIEFSEILASQQAIKELIKILNLEDSKEKEEEIIKFDLKMINEFCDNIEKIKKLNRKVSINIYPETLKFLFENKKKLSLIIEKLLFLKEKLWDKLIIEIVENWTLSNQIQIKNNLDNFLFFLNEFWLEISLDDIINLEIKEQTNENNNHIFEQLSKILIKDNFTNINYLKIDLLFTKYLVDSNLYKLINFFDFFKNNNLSHKIVFEWIESKKYIEKILRWLNKSW